MMRKVVFEMVFLVLIFLASTTVGANSCDEAVKRISVYNSSATTDYNASPTPLCSSPCCSPLLTDSSLLSSSRFLLETHVSEEAERLSESLAQRATALRESLVSAVSQSESETMEVFHSSYPRLISMIEPVIRQLFADLSNFITDTDADSLELTLSKFWDDMFPMVYHSAVHTKMAPFTQQYSDCVAKAQRTIRPWGIVPALVNEPLTRAIHSSTILLHSLHIANKVLQTSPEWFKLSPQCGATATRAFGCSLCSGILEPPCPGLCLNVARGCLSPLSELSGGWRDWLNGVARAGRAVRSSHSIFKRLPEYLPDAILVAMETGPKLQKKVKRQCGPPSHETNSTTPQSESSLATSTASAKPPAGGSVRWSGDLLIKQLVKDLYSKRDWWNNLSENFCQNSTSNSSCWNGQKVAEYKSDIANIGLSEQKYNPELQITTADSAIYAKADSLRGIKRLVLGHTSWLPESDSQRREEVARGSDYDNRPGAYGSNERGYESPYNSVDDEDTFDDGSGYGSGDWADPQTDQINPRQDGDRTRLQNTPTIHRNNKDSQLSGVEGLRSSVLPTVIASVLTLVYALH